jgi:hypothetical protein
MREWHQTNARWRVAPFPAELAGFVSRNPQQSRPAPDWNSACPPDIDDISVPMLSRDCCCTSPVGAMQRTSAIRQPTAPDTNPDASRAIPRSVIDAERLGDGWPNNHSRRAWWERQYRK